MRSGAVRAAILFGTLAAFVAMPASGGARLQQQAASSQATDSSAGGSTPQKASSAGRRSQTHPKNSTAAETAKEQNLRLQTAELLALARRLKSVVDKTNKNMLSVAVVRKAGEIEKFAHTMRSGTTADAQSK